MSIDLGNDCDGDMDGYDGGYTEVHCGCSCSKCGPDEHCYGYYCRAVTP